MTRLLAEHWGDLVVIALLAAVVAAIVAGMVRAPRRGDGCHGCSRCCGAKRKPDCNHNR